MSKKIKAYKVFNPDWTCRTYQYEVGKRYVHRGELIPCRAGFHACVRPVDCFNYYGFDPSNKVAEVELAGRTIKHGDKYVASVITVVREVPWEELLALVNTGKGNSGYANTGNYNSGSYNSGDYNIGYRNSGSYNTGNYNSGDYHSGCFNSGTAAMRLFNGNAEISRSELHQHAGWVALESVPLRPTISVIYDKDPSGTRLVTLPYQEAWAARWKRYNDTQRKLIQTLPGFCPEIFKEITGIDVSAEV